METVAEGHHGREHSGPRKSKPWWGPGWAMTQSSLLSREGQGRNFHVGHGWLSHWVSNTMESLQVLLTVCVPPYNTGTQQICPPQGQHKDQTTTTPTPEFWLTPSVACSLPSPALDTQGQYLLSEAVSWLTGCRILLAYHLFQPLGPFVNTSLSWSCSPVILSGLGWG